MGACELNCCRIFQEDKPLVWAGIRISGIWWTGITSQEVSELGMEGDRGERTKILVKFARKHTVTTPQRRTNTMVYGEILPHNSGHCAQHHAKTRTHKIERAGAFSPMAGAPEKTLNFNTLRAKNSQISSHTSRKTRLFSLFSGGWVGGVCGWVVGGGAWSENQPAISQTRQPAATRSFTGR